jgi:GST-like protein
VFDLYTYGTSNGLRASVMLEEVGAEYAVHKIDLTKGEQKSPEFLARNPFGQIPVLVDSDGPVTVQQSVAIMLYLAEKFGKFIPSDAVGRARMWQGMMSAATDVSAALGGIIAISRSSMPDNPAKAMFEERLRGLMSVWNLHFADNEFAGGDTLTVADFALYVVVARSRGVDPDYVRDAPNLDRWESVIGARPGVQRGMTVPT